MATGRHRQPIVDPVGRRQPRRFKPEPREEGVGFDDPREGPSRLGVERAGAIELPCPMGSERQSAIRPQRRPAELGQGERGAGCRAAAAVGRARSGAGPSLKPGRQRIPHPRHEIAVGRGKDDVGVDEDEGGVLRMEPHLLDDA